MSKLPFLQGIVEWDKFVPTIGMFYCYVDSTFDGVHFYVGKGSSSRARNLQARNIKYFNVALKHGLLRRIVFVSALETECLDREIELIKNLNTRAGNDNKLACNFTDGGEGTKGHIVPFWVRERVSQRQQGANNVACRPDVKAKIIAANTGRLASVQCREKISQRRCERYKHLVPVHTKILENDLAGFSIKENIADINTIFTLNLPLRYISGIKSAHKLNKCVVCKFFNAIIN